MGKQPHIPFYLFLAITFVRKNNEFKTILYFKTRIMYPLKYNHTMAF